MSRNLRLPYLPQEIITIILSKLPVKSLLQFKCVSKTWFSLISSPQFAKLNLLQLKQKKTTVSRIYMSNCFSFDPETYSDGNGDRETAIFMEHNAINDVRECFVGSCDGLICGSNDYRNEHLFVFNPTTQQVREIPTPNFTKIGIYFCGFGYDSKTDDYKIVRGVTRRFCKGGFCIEIFSLKGNSWRTVQTKNWCGDSFDEEGLLLKNSFDGAGVFSNGVLHWPTVNDIGLIRFDLGEENFLEKVSSIPDDIRYLRSLVAIDECLCVYDLNYWTFSAWKMMDYGDQNSWRRVHHTGSVIFPEQCDGFLYVTKKGHLMFDMGGFCVVVHNPVDDEIKEISKETEGDVYSIVYIESLVSPNIAD